MEHVYGLLQYDTLLLVDLVLPLHTGSFSLVCLNRITLFDLPSNALVSQ